MAEFPRVFSLSFTIVYCLAIYLVFPGCTAGTALGMENGVIPNNQISAPSSYGSGHEAWRGRLNNEPALPYNAMIDMAAWASGIIDKHQYLQVDLGQIRILTRVATQGRPYLVTNWVKRYAILYSNDGTNWEEYRENGVVKVSADVGFTVKGNYPSFIFTSQSPEDSCPARIVKTNGRFSGKQRGGVKFSSVD